MNSFVHREDGISSIEYILIALLTALAIIAGATYLGSSVNDRYDEAATSLQDIGE